MEFYHCDAREAVQRLNRAWVVLVLHPRRLQSISGSSIQVSATFRMAAQQNLYSTKRGVWHLGCNRQGHCLPQLRGLFLRVNTTPTARLMQKDAHLIHAC